MTVGLYFASSDHWNWDMWSGQQPEDEDGRGDEEESRAAGPHCEDEDFNMDADFQPGQHTASKKKKKLKDLPQMGKKRKKSHFAEVITQSKPVFDPQEKSFQQYLEEYYKLDYEDLIDDLPCRFRYRQVLPNDFGLSTNEILSASDQDLNRWCSLKKTCMFRSEQEERSDLKNYRIKAQNQRRKKEILSSVYSQDDRDQEGLTEEEEQEKGGRIRAEQRNNRGEEQQEQQEEVLLPKKRVKPEEEPQLTANQEAGSRTESPRWSRKKKQQRPGGRLLLAAGGVKIGGREFSKQRLKAYGLNPKRLYFRQLGRQKRKEQQKH